MPLTCFAQRRSRWLLLILVIALYPWSPADHQATASDATSPPLCSGATCVWLPLAGKASPVVFQGSPNIQISSNRTITIDAKLVTTAELPVYRVRYNALLFDKAKQLVQTVPITPVLEMTEPGRINLIATTFTACCDVERVELRLVSWQMSSDPSVVSLPVEQLRWTLGSGFAVAVHNNRDVPVRNVVVIVQHTTGTYFERFAVIAPGEVVIYDNPEGDDYWGFFFRTWAQGHLAP